MFFCKFLHFYKTSSCKIVHIPKPWKMPRENYKEPEKWTHKFVIPHQVRPRVFFECTCCTRLGPNDDVSEDGTYKVPEYYAYHRYSYYNIEEELHCRRCRPQPSPYNENLLDLNEKCP